MSDPNLLSAWLADKTITCGRILSEGGRLARSGLSHALHDIGSPHYLLHALLVRTGMVKAAKVLESTILGL